MSILSEKLSTDLKILESNLFDNLKTRNAPTNSVLEHIFSSGGKRLRPMIFLLVADLIHYSNDFKYKIASVCEYIHTASLLHDDVIDNSTLRRNKPTVNSIWGDETAVLAGDLIYSASCRIMVQSKNLDLIDTFAECIRMMSESELFQLEILWNLNTSVDDYFRLVYGKTAILFEASSKTPAFLAQLPEKYLSLLSDFGKNLGTAFQISDDCLDYSSLESTLGKPVCADITEGKITLPLIYAIQESEDFKNNLQKILDVPEFSAQDIQYIKDFVVNSGALKKAQEQVKTYLMAARTSLDELIQLNSNFETEAYKNLIKLSQILFDRKF